MISGVPFPMPTSSATSSRVDRQALASWYRRNRERSRALFDLLDAVGVLQPADRPAPSDRVLRRPSAGVQLQHAREEGPRPSEHRRGASNGCSRAGSIRTEAADGAPAVRAGRRATLVRAFADEADRRVLDAIERGDIDQPGHPLLDRAEAVFAILEHEAMHQETLLYMWHRLPFERKHRPAGYAPRDRTARRRAQEWIDGAGRPRDARRRRRGAIAFGWDNEFRRASRRRAGVRDRAARRDERAVPRVRRGRRLRATAAGGGPRTGRGCGARAVAHPLFWERRDERVVLARDVRSACRCRRRGRSTSARPRRRRTRAGAARGCRPKPSSSARRSAAPSGERAHPVGRRRADAHARRLRFLELGSRSRRAAIPRARARGASRIWSATAGNGRARAFAPFPGFQRDGVVSGVLGRLLRRRALRHEGRVAGDGARAAAADASATGSARAIRTSTRRSAARASREAADGELGPRSTSPPEPRPRSSRATCSPT